MTKKDTPLDKNKKRELLKEGKYIVKIIFAIYFYTKHNH